MRAGGADEIVAPAKFGGYLMADAVDTHGTIAFVIDLLSYHGACRSRTCADARTRSGACARELEGTLIVEVRRGGRRMGCWDDCTLTIEADDRLLAIDGNCSTLNR